VRETWGMADLESYPPRVGDHVRIKTPGHVIELRLVAGVPGAIVQLDLTVSMFSRDHPDSVQLAHVWVPLDALVVLPPATS
jgi:hypothetical protein